MQPTPGGPLPTGDRPSVDELSQLPLSFNFYVDQRVIFSLWDGLAPWEVAPFIGTRVRWWSGLKGCFRLFLDPMFAGSLKYRGRIWAVWVRGISSVLWQSDLCPSSLLAMKKNQKYVIRVIWGRKLRSLKMKHNLTEHKPIRVNDILRMDVSAFLTDT